MLASAIESEVLEYVAGHMHLRDAEGRRLVARNGYLPQRTIQTGIGPVDVQQPRVNDRRLDQNGQRIRFSSKILPPYLRRTKSIDELIPWLYLEGISTGDFTEALQALLGPQAKGLSATNIVRLKDCWQQEWAGWSKRSLMDKHYVYLWADGIYFNIRLEDPGNNKQCILVLMGATDDGKKELIAIADGYRESAQSWRELLLDIKERGLSTAAELATGDGALGFWAALRESYPATQEQRCWVHLRTTNPIESTFATVRLRTRRTKGCGSRMACLTMVFKLVQCAERHWRRLNSKELIVEIIQGVKFVDGIKEIAA
jgi:transposase-like protein